MSETLVREIMNEGVITCLASESLGEVAAILSDAEVSAAVVVDEAGIAQGVISQIDLVRRYGEELTAQCADEAMTALLLTISGEATVREGAAKMVKENVHRLFVLDEAGRPRGVLSMTDVVREIFKKESSNYVNVRGKAIRYGPVTLISTESLIEKCGGMVYPDFEQFPLSFDTDSDPESKSAPQMLIEASEKMFSHAYAESQGIYFNNWQEAEDYYNQTFKPLLDQAQANRQPLLLSWNGRQVDATKGVEIILTTGSGPSRLYVDKYGNYIISFQLRDIDGKMMVILYDNKSPRYRGEITPELLVWYGLAVSATSQMRKGYLSSPYDSYSNSPVIAIERSLFPGITRIELPSFTYPGALKVQPVN